eukprot:CAMPEP_0196132890 /NCGR_PEP_ID=MMETSP0910-20130528/2327_1 /TAXON_ID=49265 /ORGANISM="Thalassiosira rotula, Strain GSO102" /LENGTH=761 /DNA_ID=CAMNT_0041392541 /DNA_START=40 /DNA_END=2325 /DNA_ORIENTATION=+
MPHHHRIAIGSCSHPSLPQPLWKIIHARQPAAFIWGGDAVYSDRFAGRNWTAVGLHRVAHENDVNNNNSNDPSSPNHHHAHARSTGKKKNNGGGWRMTFPPPSIHVEATPDVIQSWYEEQWDVDDYRRFVEGWYDDVGDDDDRQYQQQQKQQQQLTRPIVFGTIDDHDYGQNNGDITYQYKRESNLAFIDFMYSGVDDAGESNSCAQDVDESNQYNGVCESSQDESNSPKKVVYEDNNNPNQLHEFQTKRRSKSNDPMYQRALEGKGVYGVSLFDFSRTKRSRQSSEELKNDSILWGGGYWVPDEDAMIDPDIISRTNIEEPFDETNINYSTTHSVAIFALDVRSNKTPWSKGKQTSTQNTHNEGSASTPSNNNTSSSSIIHTPALDFLGQHQWEWFQKALSNSYATVNIIVSGLQFHPERFPNDGNVIEEWSKFPRARQMIYDMILNSGANSPMLVSGDVHMAQFMRKDCVRSSDIMYADADDAGDTATSFKANAQQRPYRPRPLVEITTSGMTHSWGTSFSSQPRNHRLPLKLYTYFVSPIFMTICHYVCPWNDILILTEDDGKRENEERGAASPQDGEVREEIVRGGRVGMQYYLGLNFAEFEFEFDSNDDDDTIGGGDGGGAVTVRIFGKEANNAPPKLETRWTFDQLSGNTDLPGTTAKLRDFVNAGNVEYYPDSNNARSEHEWICVPHRGLASVYHEYAANIMMFFNICFLFFLPHGVIFWLFVVARRKWCRWKNAGMHTIESTKKPFNMHASEK